MTQPAKAKVMPMVSPGADSSGNEAPGMPGWLALSDERDLHLALRLAAWRDGYRAGYRAGRVAGYRRGFEEAIRGWKVTAGLLPGGPTYAELDRRRYPPDGRLAWILPRPGEDTGSRRG